MADSERGMTEMLTNGWNKVLSVVCNESAARWTIASKLMLATLLRPHPSLPRSYTLRGAGGHVTKGGGEMGVAY